MARRILPIAFAIVALPVGLIWAVPATTAPENEYFPGRQWDKPVSPEQSGWSATALTEAGKCAETIGSAAVFVVHRGRPVWAFGDVAKRYQNHSMRKSLLSALYGSYVREGKIRLTDTMADLNIDDKEPTLTAVEKQATVSALLRARSGVYHPSAHETAGMKAARPQRYSHAPGTFWYYNNWDFNVLGTIFRAAAHASIGQDFSERIAGPLQMEDFRLEDAKEELSEVSIHPAYPFRMSARDMARFGLLFLRQGRWRDRQVIPSDWVTESTRTYSAVRGERGEVRCGYGYMWWTSLNGRHLEGVDLPEGSYSARGVGGQYVLVVPRLDLVIVNRVNTDNRTGPRVERAEFGGLVKRILAAMPATLPTGSP